MDQYTRQRLINSNFDAHQRLLEENRRKAELIEKMRGNERANLPKPHHNFLQVPSSSHQQGTSRNFRRDASPKTEVKFPLNIPQKAPDDASPRLDLHQPRINKIAELRRSLDEIKNYEAKILETEKELNKNSQQMINRAITSKLNFPPHQTIFKDLPKIDAPTSEQLIQRTAKITREKNRKSQEIRDEVNELLDKLVALEFQNEEINNRAQSGKGINEDEYLGLNKFKQPNFNMPSSKKENEHFEMGLQEELQQALFGHENYLSCNRRFDPDEEAIFKNQTNECQCINSADFYTRHSQCS